jgi:hypothetical protein
MLEIENKDFDEVAVQGAGCGCVFVNLPRDIVDRVFLREEERLEEDAMIELSDDEYAYYCDVLNF